MNLIVSLLATTPKQQRRREVQKRKKNRTCSVKTIPYVTMLAALATPTTKSKREKKILQKKKESNKRVKNKYIYHTAFIPFQIKNSKIKISWWWSPWSIVLCFCISSKTRSRKTFRKNRVVRMQGGGTFRFGLTGPKLGNRCFFKKKMSWFLCLDVKARLIAKKNILESSVMSWGLNEVG